MNLRKMPISYFRAILIGIGLGLLFGFKGYLGYLYWGETHLFNWEKHLMVPLVNYTLWALLLPLVWYFVTKYKVQDSSPSERFHAILASLFMAFLHEVTSNVIYYVPMHFLGFVEFNKMRMQFIIGAFPSALISRLIEYWILYAIFTSIEYQRKFRDKQVELAQLQSQLSGAQLNALRFQLQPHFLFNTLNTVSSLMEFDTRRSQKVLSQLGTLMRRVLDEKQRNMVELREELEFIRSYLNIEQLRFHDRLTVRYQIDEEAQETLIPRLLLQPLVENAIKHGFSSQTEEGHIEVITRRRKDWVEIVVKDDGKGSDQPAAFLFSTGIGLSNVKERLALCYKDQYRLNVRSGKGQGFEVTIVIPFNRESP